MKRFLFSLFTLLALPGVASDTPAAGDSLKQVKTVFVILMENHNWEDIKGSPKAPYINSLLKQGASADNYNGPAFLHPSEPNYVWLVAGDNHGIHDDADPATNGLHGVANVATQLEAKGIAWKTYQEDIDGKTCPLVSKTPYAAKHNPFVFFDNLTDDFSANSATCIAHMRPFSEMKQDLADGKTGRYVFITPNICNDMHGARYCRQVNPQYESIRAGDDWLAQVVPMIQQSDAYRDDGVIFITWDESEGRADKPIGLLAISPLAKPAYVNTSTKFTHSALLRTVEDVFGLAPLGDAAKSGNLHDLFK